MKKSLLIISSGNGWVAVEKPAGLSVHNDPGEDIVSILKEKASSDPKLKKRTGYDPEFGFNPVHRLDRETSGVLLLACSKEVFSYLSKEFENRNIDKSYIALVHGTFEDEYVKGGWRSWDYPISKDAGGRNNPAGKGKKVNAETRYRVIDQSIHYSMVEIDLLTGRKHQIRRHAKIAKHPLTGDRRYGSQRAVDFLKENHSFNRLGLHSNSLKFYPPDSKETVIVKSPCLPEEIKTLFENDK